MASEIINVYYEKVSRAVVFSTVKQMEHAGVSWEHGAVFSVIYSCYTTNMISQNSSLILSCILYPRFQS